MARDLEHDEGARLLRSAILNAEDNLKSFMVFMNKIAVFKAFPAADRIEILAALGMTAAEVQARLDPLEAVLPTINAMTFKARYSI